MNRAALSFVFAFGCSPASAPVAPSPDPMPLESPAPSRPDAGPARLAAMDAMAMARAAALQALPPCGLDPPAGMACVPAGPFVRGVDVDVHACEQSGQPHSRRSASVPSAEVVVSAFFMDLTEVTVAAFEACVADGACSSDAGPRYLDFDRPNQPIVGVSWFDARDFCAWRGAHLPTEAEWEKAARGPVGARTPFGDDEVTCEEAVVRDERGRSCGVRKEEGSSPETGRVLAVGSRPAGAYGLYDMVGNAEEWVMDWWSEDWEACGAACAGSDPTGPCGGAVECDESRRVVRGGSWYWPAEHATGYHRRRHVPSNSPYHHFGFRCAVSLDEALALAHPD